MTAFKRLIDILSAVVLGLVLCPLILWVAVLVLLRDGRPIFFVSERMKTPNNAFGLIKFRTMQVGSDDGMATGGDKTSRITKTGDFLRAKRLDELPQLWNLLVGHVSLVGPRPPLRRYVERFPETYDEVLKARPGITGLASLVFHRHEALLLERCKTVEETDEVYVRICVPRKANLDIIYRDNQNVCWDFLIMYQTVFGRR